MKNNAPGSDATLVLIVAVLVCAALWVGGQVLPAQAAAPPTPRYMTIQQPDGAVWVWDNVEGVRVAVFDANEALPDYAQWHAARTVKALNRGNFEP